MTERDAIVAWACCQLLLTVAFALLWVNERKKRIDAAGDSRYWRVKAEEYETAAAQHYTRLTAVKAAIRDNAVRLVNLIDGGE